ncbi:MAG: TIM44-like domain-containing protein [Spirochaetales bacterium]|nr:TIM44-like domain-containing protein [Spirochaetales bacterium]MCF7938134.1 TIM44-like domain-containing protein [Spirochaetales bacterium]
MNRRAILHLLTICLSIFFTTAPVLHVYTAELETALQYALPSGETGPGFLLIIAAVVFFLLLVRRFRTLESGMKHFPAPRPLEKVPGYKEFIDKNPAFSENDLKKKVSHAFLEVQEAWSKQDLSKVRRYISDGIWQFFHTQFSMMELLDLREQLDHFQIHNIFIDRFESDGNYDIVHVGVHASMRRRFSCDRLPQLENTDTGDFIEFWSFIRKRGKAVKNIYHYETCPSCSAHLGEQMGELSRCGYCGALVNSGEYDWVLLRISQADDYAGGRRLMKAQHHALRRSSLVDRYIDFSVRQIEDRVGNGYLQILRAVTRQDLSIMRRFSTNRAFDKTRLKVSEEGLVFHRLFLNDVSLIAAWTEGEMDKLALAVSSSYQRVFLEDPPRLADPQMVTSVEVVIVQRSMRGEQSKGSLYMHRCPNCGTPVENSYEPVCQYCNAVLNSPEREWIIDDILSPAEYKRFYQENKKSFDMKVSPGFPDKLFDVHEYALNNLMAVLGAEGTFGRQEEDRAEKLAKKWGFRIKGIRPLFELAKTRRLSLKMPDDPKMREKILELLDKAEEQTGVTSPAEQQVLEYIRTNNRPQ